MTYCRLRYLQNDGYKLGGRALAGLHGNILRCAIMAVDNSPHSASLDQKSDNEQLRINDDMEDRALLRKVDWQYVNV